MHAVTVTFPHGGRAARVMADHAKDKCGVFGVWGPDDSGWRAYRALYAQQHRGQESAGIATTDGRVLRAHVGMGLVPQVFSNGEIDELGGRASIGHNRYSTTGSPMSCNAQPLMEEYGGGIQVAVGHNGNLINADLLRNGFEQRGHIFHTTTDTEIIIHLLATHHAKGNLDPVVESLHHLQGAYSVVFLFKDRIEAARDPWGWKPLVLGKTRDGFDCVASETVALDALGATFVREVEPGEIVTLSDEGLSTRRFIDAQQPAHCIFEHIYFANPSSVLFGDTVQLVRERLGEKLAEESPADADYVMPMPDSGRSAALGYARRSQIELREGIVPNRYAGRTFILPDQADRDDKVQLKLNVVAEVVRGKRLIIVDDSIVRGTTTRAKMDQLRRAGAKEIHLRISCPPIRHGCYFGIDFPDKSKLLATGRETDEIAKFLNVDSMAYLSLEGMLECVSRPSDHYCTACFSGQYRLNVDKPVSKLGLEKNQPPLF